MNRLGQLVGDVPAFLADRWDQQAFHYRSEVPLHACSLDDLDELLWGRVLRAPTDLRVTHNGIVQAVEAYAKPVRFSHTQIRAQPEPVVRPDVVTESFRAGCTLVFQGLQHHLTKVHEFCGELEYELGHSVGANAYLSPGNARGRLHFDHHDVFLIQIEGTKHWEVRAPRLERPVDDMVGQDSDPGDVVLDTTLSPGDVLYMPRGFWHLGTAGPMTSMHMTVSVCVKTIGHVLQHMVAEFARSPSGRCAVPVMQSERHAKVGQAVGDLCRSLQVSPGVLAPQVPQSNVIRTRGVLRAASSKCEARMRDRLVAVHPWAWDLSVRDDFVEVRLGERRAQIPRSAERPLRSLATSGACFVEQLTCGQDHGFARATVESLTRAGLARVETS